ncbi:LAMI_0A05248g1_1 [Lachancea mirantina]|uniref:LAMI_0A05248g1_1 n=1 Tax=Lachancea mirantina TaxID=1230905 RepID=A0A1G4IPG9_9SACH|nr:LAMI_0A05248g1_1 [Lachancea mirantina]
MVVIVASLFLPFQPQFEINATETEAAALVESQPIKIPGSSGINAETGAGVSRQRTSSVHSGSPFLNLDQGNSVDHLDGSEVRRGSEVPQAHSKGNGEERISSETFMENLTANASSTNVINSPANPVHTHSNRSVEEFFLGGHGGPGPSGHDLLSGLSSRNLSITSTPGGERPPAHAHVHDSTANLLKNVNRSLYQSVLNGSNSSVASEGKSVPQFAAPSSGTVITPKSRDLPHVSASVVDLPKKQQQQQMSLPSMRRIRRASSNAIPAVLEASGTGTSSKLKHAVTADDFAQSEVSSREDNEVIESDNSMSDIEEFHPGNVPQFGGFSNNAKIRASLLQGSKNIFASVPWKVVASGKGNGGLKNAVSTCVLEKTIEEPVTWVGSLGIPTDSIPKDVLKSIVTEMETNYHSAAVISDDVTFKGAYKNFCKQILWPTLHYQIPDNPKSKAFEDHSWNYYQHLNQQFADKIVDTYKDGDIVWVHDYHLMLVPAMVRSKIPDAKIGFFLHVSFPSSEVFRCFAQRESILQGILGANSVGFQTQEYARHFLQTTNRLLMTDVDSKTLKYKGHVINVSSTAIGIDAFNLEAHMASDQVQTWRTLIRERWAGKRLIVARDQFDRIRGLTKKLLAYELFLRANPEYIGNTVLIQICLGSDADPDLEREILVVVDRINSLSSDISVSQPVVFLHQDLDFAQYLALNCEADLFLVTTMREGMNLTCHEFVVCSRERNAPLLLSEFTGSAYVLDDGAFLINPWDKRKVAQTIKYALDMSPEEKLRRWKAMFKSIINNDSDNWVTSRLSEIQTSWEFNKERFTVFNLSVKSVASSFRSSKKRIFILKISEPPSARVLAVLTELSVHNIVFVFNSFSRNMLERLYTRCPHVGLIAENGAYVRLNGHWFNIVEDVSWKSDIIRVIEDKVERLPGSYYKTGESMIRFHTENAEDQDRVSSVVGEAITHVNTLFGERGIHAYLHKNIVFVQQVGLALKSLQFVISYFNSVRSTTNSTPQQSSENSPMLSSIVTPGVISNINTPVSTGGNSYFSLGRSISHIDFLAITGSSSPVIEPLFEHVNELAQNGSVRHCYSVVYGVSGSTYAKEHIDGLNDLLTILNGLNQITAEESQ